MRITARTPARLVGWVVMLGLVLSASVVSAQSTWSLSWTQPGATPAEAQAYLYRLSVDGGAATSVPVTCNTVTSATVCRTPRPPLGAGSHTLSLTADNGFGVSLPATITGQAPPGPISITLTLVITVP